LFNCSFYWANGFPEVIRFQIEAGMCCSYGWHSHDWQSQFNY